MLRKRVVLGIVIGLALGGALVFGGRGVGASPDRQWSGLSYASLPDEAALYLNDIVFVRDQVVLPAGEARVLLPPGTYPDTLILTEDGARVHRYRITEQAADVYYSQAVLRYGSGQYGGVGMAYSLTWESASSSAAQRTLTLEYLMSGATWQPTYDMRIVDETSVALAFFAQVHSSALVLQDAKVYLVAGRVDLSQQVDQTQQITFNQYAVGYSNEAVSLPALGVGAVELQHVYAPVTLSLEPGDTLFTDLVDTTLAARRLYVWNASNSQQVDVIYKVLNDTDLPLAQGAVRTYQDGLFMGSDFMETTPVGSEGSVTVGRLPDVRVRRAASEEYHGGSNDYYQHTVTLELENYGENDVTITVLDRWEDGAWQFEYAVEPQREPDNLLRWEVAVAAGEKQTLTYSYRTEY